MNLLGELKIPLNNKSLTILVLTAVGTGSELTYKGRERRLINKLVFIPSPSIILKLIYERFYKKNN